MSGAHINGHNGSSAPPRAKRHRAKAIAAALGVAMGVEGFEIAVGDLTATVLPEMMAIEPEIDVDTVAGRIMDRIADAAVAAASVLDGDTPAQQARPKEKAREAPNEKEQTSRNKFAPISLADCRADYAGAYVVKSLLGERQLMVLIGQPGAGKSVIAPYLAHSIAGGREVFGRRVHKKRVLYIAAEAGPDMEVRFAALRQRHGQIDGLHLIAAPVDLQSAESNDFLALRHEIEQLKPEVIVVDTIAAAFPGCRENDSDDAGRATKILRALGASGDGYSGAAVIAIHHPPKEGNTPRGHGILNGDADVVLAIEGANDEVRTVTASKNRNGRSGHQFSFAIELEDLGIDADGDMMRRPVAKEVEMAPAAARRARPLTVTEQGWLTDLKDMFSDRFEPQRRVTQPGEPEQVTLTRDQVRDGYRRRGRLGNAEVTEALSNAERQQLHKLLVALKDKGKVGLTNKLVWLI